MEKVILTQSDIILILILNFLSIFLSSLITDYIFEKRGYTKWKK